MRLDQADIEQRLVDRAVDGLKRKRHSTPTIEGGSIMGITRMTRNDEPGGVVAYAVVKDERERGADDHLKHRAEKQVLNEINYGAVEAVGGQYPLEVGEADQPRSRP